MLSFGNFKKNEINNLIGNKDPLGLYPDIDKSNNSSDTTINHINNSKPKEIHSKDEVMLLEKTNMAHDAIPHYLRAGNCNNSANTNKDEDGTPTSQVNSKSRPIRSISSGNLAKKMSFKSFKSIQQSRKRSCTNSCETSEENKIKINDGNPGSSKDPNFTSNSDEIIEQFNSKT